MAEAQTLDGFVVYLVSCVMLVGVICGFHTWDIRALRRKVGQAMRTDLEFAQKCGVQYAPSVWSVWLAAELQWKIKRRRADALRYPFILACVTFLLNGLESVVMWLAGM